METSRQGKANLKNILSRVVHPLLYLQTISCKNF